MTIAQALSEATALLSAEIENPRFEAELLLAHHLGVERSYLLLHSEREVEDMDGFDALIARRAAHEPYEYITGSAGFYDIDLTVAPGVLIPRPETELLVEKAAEIIRANGITEMVEIGVGSGAISIVLARLFPDLRITATDISPDALRIAAGNIEKFSLTDRITLIESNLMDEVTTTPQLVVSNPPYIADDFELEKNVRDYEPHSALFGGKAGDELLKQIIDDVKARGIEWLACEMGYDQKELLSRYLDDLGVSGYEFYMDYGGFDRGFVAHFS